MRERGIIQGIRIALGTGTIRPDDGGDDLTFGRDALADGAFEELREGQPVTFTADGDASRPTRRLARRVVVLGD